MSELHGQQQINSKLEPNLSPKYKIHTLRSTKNHDEIREIKQEKTTDYQDGG